MVKLDVRLFGRFEAGWDGELITGFETRKAQELFCYLLLFRDRPHPREALASLLWSDCSTSQSRGYLRKALWQLQSSLSCPNNSIQDQVILVESDWVQFNPDIDLFLDVKVFEETFKSVEGIHGTELVPQQAQGIKHAIDLYRGALLEGWYQEWCLYERERLQHIYLALLDKLIGYCERYQAYEKGIAYGMLILNYDHARERTHRRMMRLYSLAGDRTAALRQYERCRLALAEELGVRPSNHTTALFEAIQADQFPGSDEAVEGSLSTIENACKLPGFLQRLKEFHTVVGELQKEIRRQIQEVELAIHDQP